MPYVQGSQKPTPNTGRGSRKFPNTEDPDNVAEGWASPDALGSSSSSPRRRRRRRSSLPLARVVLRPDSNAAIDPQLGDTTTAKEPAVISQWRADVAARTSYDGTHNVATRMPSGPSTGQLAERYHDIQGVSRYALAPAAVLAADQAIGQQLDQDIAAGQRAQIIEQAPVVAAQAVQRLATGTAQLVGDTTRGAVGGLLGIPSWSVPAALGVAAIIAVKLLLPGLIPWGRR